MSRWFLLRHGQSTANAGGWLSGWKDVSLTDRGREQARSVDVPSGLRIVSSDLSRAMETALLACGRAPDRTEPQLRERHLGAWEGRSRALIKGEDPNNARLLSWEDGPPRGEAHLHLARRVLGLLVQLDDGVDTVLVAHGAVNRTLVGLLDGVPYAEVGLGQVRNCELIERAVPAGTWRRLAEQVGVVEPDLSGLPTGLGPELARVARDGGVGSHEGLELFADAEHVRIGDRRVGVRDAYDLAARLWHP